MFLRNGGIIGTSIVIVTQSCLTLCYPQTVAHQAPLSMEFSRQEYWTGLPLPSPGDLPDSGIEPGSPVFRQILYHLSYIIKSLSLSLSCRVEIGSLWERCCRNVEWPRIRPKNKLH